MLRPWCLMVSLVLLSLAGRAVALQLPSPISLVKDASLRSQAQGGLVLRDGLLVQSQSL